MKLSDFRNSDLIIQLSPTMRWFADMAREQEEYRAKIIAITGNATMTEEEYLKQVKGIDNEHTIKRIELSMKPSQP